MHRIRKQAEMHKRLQQTWSFVATIDTDYTKKNYEKKILCRLVNLIGFYFFSHLVQDFCEGMVWFVLSEY